MRAPAGDVVAAANADVAAWVGGSVHTTVDAAQRRHTVLVCVNRDGYDDQPNGVLHGLRSRVRALCAAVTHVAAV